MHINVVYICYTYIHKLLFILLLTPEVLAGMGLQVSSKNFRHNSTAARYFCKHDVVPHRNFQRNSNQLQRQTVLSTTNVFSTQSQRKSSTNRCSLPHCVTLEKYLYNCSSHSETQENGNVIHTISCVIYTYSICPRLPLMPTHPSGAVGISSEPLMGNLSEVVDTCCLPN